MAGMYALVLCAVLMCLALVDYRWKLAFWHDARRTVITLFVGVVWFLLWDAAGVAIGIFFEGASPYLLGLFVAPHIPLEEILFLTLLCYQALLLYLLIRRRMT